MPETRAHTTPLHRPASTGDAFWAMGSLFEMKLTAAETAGEFGLAEVGQPVGVATPLHVHRDEAEVFYVLDGTMRYEAGGTVHELAPGSTMYLPVGIPHRFRITGDRPARILAMVFPGKLLDLYTEVGAAAGHRSIPAVPAPDEMAAEIARWGEIGPRYGLTVIGPPLPEEG
jgi:quercetin dioxygenase-like cupin family protein